MLAAAAMQTAFQKDELSLQDIVFERRSANGAAYRKLILGVGRRDGVAPNHIVSAVAGAANIPGKDIGKIEIYDARSIVGVPAARAEQIARRLKNLKINGHPASVRLSQDAPSGAPRRAPKPAPHPQIAASVPTEPARRGKIRLSPEAKARLLDASDLSRFEIQKPKDRKSGQKFDHKHPAPKRRPDTRKLRERGNRKNSDRGSIHRNKKG